MGPSCIVTECAESKADYIGDIGRYTFFIFSQNIHFLISRKRNEDTEASKFGKEITSRNHYSFVDPLVSGRSSMQEQCPSVSARLARTCMTYWPLAASTLQEEGICAARLIPLSTVGQACFTLASTQGRPWASASGATPLGLQKLVC